MARSVDEAHDVDDTRLDALATEAGSKAGADYDLRPTLELVELMSAQDATVPAAVASATAQIAAATEAIGNVTLWMRSV